MFELMRTRPRRRQRSRRRSRVILQFPVKRFREPIERPSPNGVLRSRARNPCDIDPSQRAISTLAVAIFAVSLPKYFRFPVPLNDGTRLRRKAAPIGRHACAGVNLDEVNLTHANLRISDFHREREEITEQDAFH